MASIIWDRDPQEAINNPYEYNAQKQFHREAITLTGKLSEMLKEGRYYLQEMTLEKAIWMLQTDALFAFRDAVILLEQKRHRVVGRLLRDILEAIHLIEYLNSKTTKSEKLLLEWFVNDELIMHREYRDYVKAYYGENEANIARDNHRILSKFTHRSYRILLYSYIRGSEDRMWFDDGTELPQSVAMYYAFLGQLGGAILENLKDFGMLTPDDVNTVWSESMEPEQIPRGFLSKEDKEFLGINDD